MRDRGRVRKERFKSWAFSWQLREFQKLQEELGAMIGKAVDEARRRVVENELARRNVDLLRGHNFDRPIASMAAGSLKVTDSRDALRFEAELPERPALAGSRTPCGPWTRA